METQSKVVSKLLNEKEREKFSQWLSEMETAREMEVKLNPNLKEQIN
jgi:hypothetical protein